MDVIAQLLTFCWLAFAVWVVCGSNDQKSNSLEVLEWRGGDLRWPSHLMKEKFVQTGQFIRKNSIATRTQVFKHHAFFTCPRLRSGIAATLVRASLKPDPKHEPEFGVLEPYPNWKSQELGNCEALQNAVDMYKDDGDTLWVLDSGATHSSFMGPKCFPKVVAFNVVTGKLSHLIVLHEMMVPGSKLQYIVCDVDQQGKKTLYISDTGANAILTLDVATHHGHRLQLPSSIPPSFNPKDVLYLLLVKRPSGNVLFFSYLSSPHLFSLDVKYANPSFAERHIKNHGEKPYHMVFLGTDNGEAIFFRYEGKSEIYRWDTTTQCTEANFIMVQQGNQRLYATHIVPDFEMNGMRVLETDFQEYMKPSTDSGAHQSLSVMHSI